MASSPAEDVVDRVFRRAKSSQRVLTEQEILDEIHVAQNLRVHQAGRVENSQRPNFQLPSSLVSRRSRSLGIRGIGELIYNPPARDTFHRGDSMRVHRYTALLLIAGASRVCSAQTSPLSADQRAQFHGPYSQPEEAFRLVGNIYYVGAKNIASYLITTPQGHILVDTGTTEMTPVITANVEKLGFKMRDIKIMLPSHAHFDHIGGHAAMKKLHRRARRWPSSRTRRRSRRARIFAARRRGLDAGEGRSRAQGRRHGGARRHDAARRLGAGPHARLHGLDDDRCRTAEAQLLGRDLRLRRA